MYSRLRTCVKEVVTNVTLARSNRLRIYFFKFADSIDGEKTIDSHQNIKLSLLPIVLSIVLQL